MVNNLWIFTVLDAELMNP